MAAEKSSVSVIGQGLDPIWWAGQSTVWAARRNVRTDVLAARADRPRAVMDLLPLCDRVRHSDKEKPVDEGTGQALDRRCRTFPPGRPRPKRIHPRATRESGPSAFRLLKGQLVACQDFNLDLVVITSHALRHAILTFRRYLATVKSTVMRTY